MSISYPDNTASRSTIPASGLTDSTLMFDVISGGERSLSLAELKKTGVQVVNVKQYGAVGDGATDDTVAIQAAIDISTSGTLYVPVGNYKVSTLNINNTIRITGNGTLTLKTSGEYPILNIVSGNNVQIENLYFDGNRSVAGSSDTFLIKVYAGNNFNCNNVYFTNNKAGIRISSSTNCTINNLNCYDFTHGQVTIKDGCSRNIISNSTFNDNGNMSVSLHVIDLEATSSDLVDCIVANNSISSIGTSVQLTGVYVSHNSVTSNIFRNNDTTGNGNCFKSDTCGAGNSVRNNTMYFTNYGIFDSSSSPLIYNNNVLLFNSIGTGTRHGIRIATSRSVVKNNTIFDAPNHAILVASSVDHCQISENTIVAPGQDGINIEGSTSNNNFILNNNIDKAIRYGIRVDASSNIICNNIIRNGSGVYGSYVAGSNCIILDNYLEGNSNNYIRFGSVSGCYIRSYTNTLINSLPAGNYFSCTDRFLIGTGSPESVIVSNIGSSYLRTDGSTNTTLYVKESGSGNTGWVAK